MAQNVQSTTGVKKSTFLVAAGLLLYAGMEAIKAGDLYLALPLVTLAVANAGVYELLSQNQFAFEEDLALLLDGIEGEDIANESEEIADQLGDDIRDIVEDR